jgi:hypothetical protein
VSEYSLKLHNCMFEKSQMKNNSWDFHFFKLIFFINCKVYMLET